MSQIHEKKHTNYFWIRNNPALDADVKLGTHGYQYLYEHVPNKKERLDMIYRSMEELMTGNLNDLEYNILIQARKKFPYKGNKKIFFKNLFRLFNHPLGMIYWKSYKQRCGKGR